MKLNILKTVTKVRASPLKSILDKIHHDRSQTAESVMQESPGQNNSSTETNNSNTRKITAAALWYPPKLLFFSRIAETIKTTYNNVKEFATTSKNVTASMVSSSTEKLKGDVH